MKFQEAIKRFLNCDCLVTTHDDEYTGVLTEVGDDYILLVDEDEQCLLNLAFVESISPEEL